MTPAQVEEAARRRYNSLNDGFWTSDEVRKLIYSAELILAVEAKVIESVDTSITTVASTRAYAFPTGCLGIKRIEAAGLKLRPIDMREYDALTLNNTTSTVTGQPAYYFIWDEQIYLHPTPDAAYVLTIYQYQEPTLLDNTSTVMNTPIRCHMNIVDFVTREMAAKDTNWEAHDRYDTKWNKYVDREKANSSKRKRTDSFATVKDEESLSNTLLGIV